MNIFRVGFSMERLVPDSLAGPVADEYFQDLVEVRPFFSLASDLGHWSKRSKSLTASDGQRYYGPGCVCSP